MSSFYISATHKSSGKTTLSIGICAAIRQRGLSIQAFKKGPDYIDPIWLHQATGSACHNLDFYTSSHQFILQQYQRYQKNKDVVLVEGNMGLFDGMALDGSDSNAAMTKLLRLPVILVIDTSGTSRGIAPLLNGYVNFDSDIQYAGVILNKVAGNRHETKLRNVIEEYTDLKILGAVPRNTEIQVTERHLGLIPSNEIAEQSDNIINLLATQARENINIDSLLAIESIQPSETSFHAPDLSDITPPYSAPKMKIAVAMDEAFGFYYPGDLLQFSNLGVEIIPFSCTKDPALPKNIDGLFIGGGFPEMQVAKLAGNTTMLNSINNSIINGLPTYAECGGMMYLCSHLIQHKKSFQLCGVIPATVNMNKRPQGRGYVILETTDTHPWMLNKKQTITAHEFHYSTLQNLPDDLTYAYSIKRGTGIDGINDGIIMHNMVASYTHLRQTDWCNWVDDFVSFVKSCKYRV